MITIKWSIGQKEISHSFAPEDILKAVEYAKSLHKTSYILEGSPEDKRLFHAIMARK
jgi:hypothetical protein